MLERRGRLELAVRARRAQDQDLGVLHDRAAGRVFCQPLLSPLRDSSRIDEPSRPTTLSTGLAVVCPTRRTHADLAPLPKWRRKALSDSGLTSPSNAIACVRSSANERA